MQSSINGTLKYKDILEVHIEKNLQETQNL